MNTSSNKELEYVVKKNYSFIFSVRNLDNSITTEDLEGQFARFNPLKTR